jgi:HlyD family secretion protein
VVTLEEPPTNLRPGLSATAKVTTATRQGVLTIPIQALTIRQKSDLEEQKSDKGAAQAAAPAPADKKKEDIQGVFVIRDRKAVFVPVETGITGVTEIEVTSGLKDGEDIVTGSYRVLRSLRNGAGVKVEKPSERKKEDQES